MARDEILREDELLRSQQDEDDRSVEGPPNDDSGLAGSPEGLSESADPLGLSLRPRSLDEFVGQSELKRRLSVILEAARRRNQPPDHFLFAGPPGLGKTSLSGIVANEMGVTLHVTSGPALERPGDLAAILTKLGHGDVLFIDEIHRLSRSVEEVLYPAMEDFQLDIVLGKGPAARSIRLDLPQFCLVGATTRTGLITGPLRDRFGLVARLDFYEADDLALIVLRASEIMGAVITHEGAMEIARRSRGTPRIANRLLRRVRDVADVEGDGTIDAASAAEGLAIFGIDELGLDKVDRSILSALCERFGGGPLGLSTLAIAVAEPTETVEDVYEPFLIQQGLLARTPRGRVATAAAWAHLGLAAPRGDAARACIPGTDHSLFD
ncbi:MAG: Holliday junction branch migration DNA helicase RuvB [Microthrixaceae bacterium]